eukprot:gene22407-29519_t
MLPLIVTRPLLASSIQIPTRYLLTTVKAKHTAAAVHQTLATIANYCPLSLLPHSFFARPSSTCRRYSTSSSKRYRIDRIIPITEHYCATSSTLERPIGTPPHGILFLRTQGNSSMNVSFEGNRPEQTTDPARCPPAMKELIELCWHADPDIRLSAAQLLERLEFISASYTAQRAKLKAAAAAQEPKEHQLQNAEHLTPTSPHSLFKSAGVNEAATAEGGKAGSGGQTSPPTRTLAINSSSTLQHPPLPQAASGRSNEGAVGSHEGEPWGRDTSQPRHTPGGEASQPHHSPGRAPSPKLSPRSPRTTRARQQEWNPKSEPLQPIANNPTHWPHEQQQQQMVGSPWVLHEQQHQQQMVRSPRMSNEQQQQHPMVYSPRTSHEQQQRQQMVRSPRTSNDHQHQQAMVRSPRTSHEQQQRQQMVYPPRTSHQQQRQQAMVVPPRTSYEHQRQQLMVTSPRVSHDWSPERQRQQPMVHPPRISHEQQRQQAMIDSPRLSIESYESYSSPALTPRRSIPTEPVPPSQGEGSPGTHHPPSQRRAVPLQGETNPQSHDQPRHSAPPRHSLSPTTSGTPPSPSRQTTERPPFPETAGSQFQQSLMPRGSLGHQQRPQHPLPQHSLTQGALGEQGAGAYEAQGEEMHRGSAPIPIMSRSINASGSYDEASFHWTAANQGSPNSGQMHQQSNLVQISDLRSQISCVSSEMGSRGAGSYGSRGNPLQSMPSSHDKYFALPREGAGPSDHVPYMPGWEGSTPPWASGEEGNLPRRVSGPEGEISRSPRQGDVEWSRFSRQGEVDWSRLSRQGDFELTPRHILEAPLSPRFQRRLGDYSEAGSNTAGSETAASSLSHRLSSEQVRVANTHYSCPATTPSVPPAHYSTDGSFGPGQVLEVSETMWTSGSSMHGGPSWTEGDPGERRALQKHSQVLEYDDTDRRPPQGYHRSPESSPNDVSAPHETYQHASSNSSTATSAKGTTSGGRKGTIPK